MLKKYKKSKQILKLQQTLSKSQLYLETFCTPHKSLVILRTNCEAHGYPVLKEQVEGGQLIGEEGKV